MKSNSFLVKFSLLVLATFFLIKGAVQAEAFLVPLTFAVMLTLILIPLARKLEKIGLSHFWATFVSVLLSVLAYLAFFFVIALQIGSVSERWPEMEKQFKPKISEAIEMMEEKTGMNIKKQIPPWLNNPDTADKPMVSQQPQNEEENQEPKDDTQNQTATSQSSSASGEGSDMAVSDGIKKQLGQVAMNLFSFLGNSSLAFIYLFFLLHYRHKVKLSILRFFDEDKREKVDVVLEDSVKLSLNFLVGRLLLMLSLAIIYTAGLLLAGVPDAILIGLIGALLSLIPFVGVIGGYLLAIALTLMGGAETWALIVVSATYGIAQFIEGNILEPYLVGNKVNINPLVTIIVVVLGSAIWGVAGMILSIPLAGMLKIVFDSVDKLNPLGYMLGEEDVSDPDDEGFFSKWGSKILGKKDQT